MKISKSMLKQANMIARNYSGWLEPKQFVKIYNVLNEVGIVVPAWDYSKVSKAPTGTESVAVPFELDGEQVENSLFAMSCYKGENGRNEYNVYFS